MFKALFFNSHLKHYRNICLYKEHLSFPAIPATESGEAGGEIGSVEAVRTFEQDFTNRNATLVFLVFAIIKNFFSCF